MMSKITNDDLTRSGIGCFIVVPIWHQWASKGKIGQHLSKIRWNIVLLLVQRKCSRIPSMITTYK